MLAFVTELSLFSCTESIHSVFLIDSPKTKKTIHVGEYNISLTTNRSCPEKFLNEKQTIYSTYNES